LNQLKENISKPIIGKTYSLYGGALSSDNFYTQLAITTDEIIDLFQKTPEELLHFISDLSKSRIKIKRSQKKDQFSKSLMEILRRDLTRYLINVEEHLRNLKFNQHWEKALSTSSDQYLLYLLEIELTNRIYIKQFLSSKKKLAFLPHCIRDFSTECQSEPDEIDNLCKACSKRCTINSLSRLLKKSDIIPYIWLQADLKKIFDSYKNKENGIGVLGIACIPELTFGMRFCRKFNVPVIGVPLDANRCRRWMGDFYENSVNFKQLKSLLSFQELEIRK
jgi:hypothetical protein